MNEKTINSIIEAAIKNPTKIAVIQATNRLLGESDLKVGQDVAVVDEDNVNGGYIGRAKVKKLPDNTSGQVEIELPNGTTTYALQSLLVGL